MLAAIAGAIAAQRRGGNDVIALLAQLSFTPTFFLDRRYGVSATGGAVDSWEDARGTGKSVALPVTAAGTARPSYANQVVTFDGVNNVMAGPAVAALSLAAQRTLFYVGTMTVATNTALIAALSDAASAKYAGLAPNGTAQVSMRWLDNTTNGNVAGNSVGVPTANRIIAKCTAGGGTVRSARVFNLAALGAVGGAYTDGAFKLVVGSFSTVNIRNGGDVCALFDAPGIPTANDEAAIIAWAQQYHGAVVS